MQVIYEIALITILTTQASEKPCSIAVVQKSPTLGLGRVFFASLYVCMYVCSYVCVYSQGMHLCSLIWIDIVYRVG